MTVRKLFRAVWVLALTLLLAVSGGLCLRAEEDFVSPWDIPDNTEEFDEPEGGDGNDADYTEVARTELHILMADMRTGLFKLVDRVAGNVWHSVPDNTDDDTITKGAQQRMAVRSQLAIEYVYRDQETVSETTTVSNSQTGCIQNGQVTVASIDRGIRVDYAFSELGFYIPVTYTLGNGWLEATVLTQEIREGDTCYLMAINLLPAFGAGSWEDDGYMFVPDGCGALVRFNNQVLMTTPYHRMVYGEELANPSSQHPTLTETVRLPVFGTVHTEQTRHGLMGVITKGAGAAGIAVINGNERCGYNAVSATLHQRILSKQENIFNKKQVSRVSRTDYTEDAFTIRYYTLSGNSADYTGMAGVFRDYLVQEKGLVKNPQPPALNIDLIGSVGLPASFLGIPYTRQESLTTFSQARIILDALHSGGAGRLVVRYRGWSNNGLSNNKIPNKAAPLGNLGGKKGFARLTDYANEHGIGLYPDTDLLSFRSGGRGIRKNGDAIRTPFRQIAFQHEYMLSVYATVLEDKPVRLLTPRRITEVAGTYLKALRKVGLKSVGLSTLGNTYYGNLDESKGDYRSRMETVAEETLRRYRDAGITLAMDAANAYALPYANRIVNAPTTSSGYDLFDEDVPFYQILLHGYVSTALTPTAQVAESELHFLKAVEFGSELLYTGMYASASKLTDTRFHALYGTTYTAWQEDACINWKTYSQLMEAIYDQTITGHSQPVPNVFRTTYANGVAVLVNYSDEDSTVDGQTVPAAGFIWTGVGT